MKKMLGVLLIFVNLAAYALPYRIVPEGTLPTSIANGATLQVTYTVTNNTSYSLNSMVQYLPPNVSQVTGSGLCGSPFTLAPGGSCNLQLSVSGSVNGNDPNQHNHLFICVVGSGGQTCAGPSQANTLNVKSLSDYANWVTGLSPGYTTEQGSVFLMLNTDCPEFVSVFGSCFGQNPAAPYIIPEPPIEQSYVDPDYATTFENQSSTGNTTDMFYRLSDNDALVTIISYPPKAAYLGYQSYVFSREISDYAGITPPRAPVVSPDPDRYELFGSLGNDQNSVIFQNQYNTPWGADIALYITTSNQNLANALIANATAAGIDPRSILVEPVGPNVITGNDASADDMATLFRYAVPEDSTAGAAWESAASTNVLVYKVTNPDITVSRFSSTNYYTAHVVNNSETDLAAGLSSIAAVLQTYLASAQGEAAGVEPTLPTTVDNSQGIPTSGLVGSNCIQYGTLCEGDNQDTSTYTYLVLDHLAANETAFIVGVDHNVPGVNNTYYVSDDIYNAANSSGVASSSQTNPTAVGFSSGVLTGSAAAVLSDLGLTPPNGVDLSNYYITFIARNCNNSTISAASAYCINLQGVSLVPLIDPISVTERSYVVPGKTTGGYVPEMIYPSVVAATADFGS